MSFEVKLISYTSPQILVGGGKPEDLIVYTARVSNPKNQMNMETAPKLIKYLLDNSHMSPFEMVDMCVEVKTSRAIAAQILRHWSFSFQEFSQRYAAADSFVEYPARRQDQKNRQNSIDDMSEQDKEWFSKAQHEVWDKSHALYSEALARGIAKEQARFLLPLNTATTLYMKANVRDWIFYLKLRSANGTQAEHANIAIAIRDTIFKPLFPNTSAAMGW